MYDGPDDDFDDVPPPPDYPESWDVLDEDDLEWIEIAASAPPGLTPDRQAISQSSADDLKTDVQISSDAENREKQITRLREARVRLEEDDNRRRNRFFHFALFIVGIPVAVASVSMLKLTIFDTPDANVVIAFFASVVVEVIGISAIIARYLFPSGGNGASELPGEKRPPTAD